jgi:hypothetical protein
MVVLPSAASMAQLARAWQYSIKCGPDRRVTDWA